MSRMRAEGPIRMSVRKAFFPALMLAGVTVLATPPLTTIQDVLYRADGGLFDGTAEITWKSFTASDASFVAQNLIPVRIVNGQLRVRLVPTTTASAGAYYMVRYNTNGITMFTETWSVPPSSGALKVGAVRVISLSSGGGGTPVTPPGSIVISDILGLSDALDIRPVKGVQYTAGRVAFIDEMGAIGVVLGDPGDCVRVDGTAGPCGTGGGGNITFVDLEIPAGTLNGVNAAFTLSTTPAPASSVHLFRNGLLQRQGTDYNLSAATATFVTGAIPQPGDILLASYRVTQ